MIRPLSGDSFCIFGHILRPEAPFPRANRYSLSLTPGVTQLYRTGSDTWLGNESGTVVLSVSTDGSTYTDFYLDASVQLKDGVWFSLTALQGTAMVQMAAVVLPGPEQTRLAKNDFSAYPCCRVTAIHTLFCQEKEQDFLFPGESHGEAELVYVDAGSLHSVAQGQDLLLERGDLVLYPPGQWHMQYAPPGQAPRLLSITFDAEGLDWNRLENRKFTDTRASTLLRLLLQEQEKMDGFSQDMIFTVLQLLLLHLQRQEQKSGQPVQALHAYHNENEIIRRAQEYVSGHVYEKLSVPAVAAGVGVSASYLTALFQKHLQIAPAEYIRRIKLQKSRQLIREGERNLSQIAKDLQYSTVAHFSRQFKEKFGVTPSEYAKAVRG